MARGKAPKDNPAPPPAPPPKTVTGLENVYALAGCGNPEWADPDD